MAQDPGIGDKMTATITEVKGNCGAGHQLNETFEISCYNPNRLCGWFYHKIFADLQTFQFGGSLSWWTGDTITEHCPDPFNQVTMIVERKKR
jgi:uncharacterized repeat protein (TIGR04076 family)